MIYQKFIIYNFITLYIFVQETIKNRCFNEIMHVCFPSSVEEVASLIHFCKFKLIQMNQFKSSSSNHFSVGISSSIEH